MIPERWVKDSKVELFPPERDIITVDMLLIVSESSLHSQDIKASLPDSPKRLVKIKSQVLRRSGVV